MTKPLIKCRINGGKLRYVVIDPSFSTWKTISVFPPQSGIGTYNVWGDGPVQRHESLQSALQSAVQTIALASAVNAKPAALSPMPLTPAE